MSAGFTPGPWECFQGQTSYYRGDPENDPEPGVITAPNDGLILAVAVSNAVPDVAANMHLIAAAPTLYAKVEIAATIFREYERIHAEKGTVEGDMKARRNAQYAEEMEAAAAQARGQIGERS